MILCPEDYDFKAEEPRRFFLRMQGAMMVALEDDKALRFWSVGYPGVDLIACLIEGSNGTRHLMGRVRLHLDDQITGSIDRKVPVHVIFPPPTEVQSLLAYARETLRGVLASIGLTGRDLIEVDLGGRGPEAIDEAMLGLAENDTDWDASATTYRVP